MQMAPQLMGLGMKPEAMLATVRPTPQAKQIQVTYLLAFFMYRP